MSNKDQKKVKKKLYPAKLPRTKPKKSDVIEGCYFGYRKDGSFFITGV